MVKAKILGSLLGLTATTRISNGEPVTSYTFPTTDYPVFNSIRGADGGMVHGLCVLGASEASVSISNDDSGFTYTPIPDFKDGVKAFGDAWFGYSGVNGNGPQVCEGGLFLQPSLRAGPPPGVDVTLDVTGIDLTTGATICVILEEKYTHGNWDFDRQGNWKQALIDDGFKPSDTTLMVSRQPGKKTSYCKTFSPPPPFPVDGYRFPTTDYPKMHTPRHADGGMVHALCVRGASDVTTNIDYNGVTNFRYNKLPKLQNGVKAFGDYHFQYVDVDGKGAPVCEGGIYLQPQNMYGPPPGTDVTVDVTPINEETEISLCLFVEEPFTDPAGRNRDRLGNWKDHVIADGFSLAQETITYYDKYPGFTVYCKTFSPAKAEKVMVTTSSLKGSPTTLPPTGFPTGLYDVFESCPEDIKLLRTVGETDFPAILSEAVGIVSQDKSTVTIALNQAWDSRVDKYFYEYEESSFSSKCYEEEGVDPGQLIDTITIQCFTLTHQALLHICVQDTSGGLLSAADDAALSNCCHSDAPNGTPTVCYTFEVMCETSCGTEDSLSSRNLRARI